ncbi:MAG: hypothetical protein INQ03_26065 [Candidatus Heimdallarchaeota archaeon]|nr:hypothetical protein [Candidatus Heimdallarchaeota archaeon]
MVSYALLIGSIYADNIVEFAQEKVGVDTGDLSKDLHMAIYSGLNAIINWIIWHHVSNLLGGIWF